MLKDCQFLNLPQEIVSDPLHGLHELNLRDGAGSGWMVLAELYSRSGDRTQCR
jgi:hypothetical protein